MSKTADEEWAKYEQPSRVAPIEKRTADLRAAVEATAREVAREELANDSTSEVGEQDAPQDRLADKTLHECKKLAREAMRWAFDRVEMDTEEFGRRALTLVDDLVWTVLGDDRVQLTPDPPAPSEGEEGAVEPVEWWQVPVTDRDNEIQRLRAEIDMLKIRVALLRDPANWRVEAHDLLHGGWRVQSRELYRARYVGPPESEGESDDKA